MDGENAAERLTRALRDAGASALMIERASQGYYGDFTSPLSFPITALVDELRRAGLTDLAKRAQEGDFDGE